MSYEITKKITKFNQSGIKMNTIIGGLQHSTGNGKDTAIGNNNWFNTGDRKANAHFFLDNINIIQNVETFNIAWHGRKPASLNRWGCEMCETRDSNEFKEIWKRQVWLWAYLFTQVANPRITKVTIETLRSHKEENDINHKGDSNNHQDPHAYFAKFGKTMDDMRNDVQKVINEILEKEKQTKIETNKEVKRMDTVKSNEQIMGEKAVDELVKKGLINSPDKWKAQDLKNTSTPLWLFFEMLNRLSK